MTWHVLHRDGFQLKGFSGGEGDALIFQHGLGGDEAQVASVLPEFCGHRLTLECRAHGRSDAGDTSLFSISTFADDVLAFADQQGIDRFAVGGISMGAAIALRIAIKQPTRVTALILSRPAWLWSDAPENMRVIAKASDFIEHGRKDDFLASVDAGLLRAEAPDNLASLLGMFDRQHPKIVTQLLKSIAGDGPGVTENEVRSLSVPTLVLATKRDLVHPLSHATTLAGCIPLAEFVELTPKATDKTAYTNEHRAAVSAFLSRRKFNRDQEF